MSKIKILNKSTFIEIMTIERIVSSFRREKINSDYLLEFTTYIDSNITAFISPNYIVEENDDYFDFVYYKKGQSQEGLLTAEVECEHVSYRLNDPEYNLSYFTELGTPEYILGKLLEGTGFTIGTIEFTEEVAYSLQEATSRRMALMDFVDYLGGEIQFNKFTISILTNRGSDIPKDLTAGRNIEIIDMIFNKREKDSLGNPLVSYTCSLIRPMEINLGDVVTLDYETLDIDVSLRVVSIENDPYNFEYASFEIGNFVPGLEDDARKIEVSTVKAGKKYFGSRISSEVGFESILNDNTARAYFNALKFAMQVGDGTGENWVDKLYIETDPETGISKLMFDGELTANVINAIKATIDIVVSNITITNILSAQTANIAELTVDRIETSDKVQKYDQSIVDKSDVDYWRGMDQFIRFITAEYVGDIGGVLQTENVYDRFGNQLFWLDEEHSGITDDGAAYPNYPVKQLRYNELVKLEIAFEEIDGVKQPYFALGAGYGSSLYPDRGKFFIRKSSNGAKLAFIKNDGTEVAIEFSEDGLIGVGGSSEKLSSLAFYANGFVAVYGADTVGYRWTTDGLGRITQLENLYESEIVQISWNGGNV